MPSQRNGDKVAQTLDQQGARKVVALISPVASAVQEEELRLGPDLNRHSAMIIQGSRRERI